MKYNSFAHGEMTLVWNGRVSTQKAFRVGEIRDFKNNPHICLTTISWV